SQSGSADPSRREKKSSRSNRCLAPPQRCQAPLKAMLLAVDVGNTQTVFGLYDGPELGERWRIATEAQRTGDELGALLADFLEFSELDGICLSCTVPRLIREYEHVAERWVKAPLLVIG